MERGEVEARVRKVLFMCREVGEKFRGVSRPTQKGEKGLEGEER